MRRTLGLAATCLLSAFLLAGCGGTGNLINPQPTPTPVVPSVTAEIPTPTAASVPTSITRGNDGNLWFTEQASNKIGKLVGATITEPVQLGAGAAPTSIASGPDNDLWVTESGTDKIAKISPTTGVLAAEYNLSAGAKPQQIVAGPDGNLWFTEAGNGVTPNRIGSVTTAGVVTEYNIPTPNAGLTSIAVGPDGALWFTERTASKIGRITTGGAVTAETPTQTPAAQPFQILLGPDGAMWFTEVAVDRLGRITNSGAPTDVPVTSVSSVAGFILGNDNKFYIADPTANKIAQVNVSGTLSATEYAVPSAAAFSPAASFPGMLVIGYDGKVYMTENNASKIAQFTYF